ncbi:MAG: Brp/Blh family beta-carotene 15,15'-monooxygenase [Candidatus Endobugula sp.]|jgi:Brp/Blh family beta-carotene 15,15'-monooxygenase
MNYWAMYSWDTLAIATILLIGVPHGGLDGALARRIGWPSGLMSWLGFHLAYIALAAMVAGVWWLFPLFSLVIFLLISALHFGASDIADIGSDWLPWLTHGGLVCIVIPSLQATSVEPIFAVLAGVTNADLIMRVISTLFVPWAFCFIGYCGYTYYKPQYRKPLISLMILVGLTSILPPLISFSLYFCLWHSRGHMLRLWRRIALIDRNRSLREAAVYTLLAWISLGIIFYWFKGTATDSLMQITFIGLAALTLPHMLLVDFADRKTNKQEAFL